MGCLESVHHMRTGACSRQLWFFPGSEFVNLSRQCSLSHQETPYADRLAASIPYIVGHGLLPSVRRDIFTTSQCAPYSEFTANQKTWAVEGVIRPSGDLDNSCRENWLLRRETLNTTALWSWST